MDRPVIENAPGLVWKRRSHGYAAHWQARTDLVRRGFTPKQMQLWSSTARQPDPTQIEREWISDRCQAMQGEMLLWAQEGDRPAATLMDGTLKRLIGVYQTDEGSPYFKLRHRSRLNYDGNLLRIVKAHGDEKLKDIKARLIKTWHREWSAGGKVSMGHAMVAMLRVVFNFGASDLEDEDCERLCVILHRLSFDQGRPRKERLTAEQADAVRAKAHEMGYPSLALAQAFQFEGTMRQKDIIGEYVPVSEPGIGITYGNEKWMRGIDWHEIDESLILTHTTSKKNKEIVVNLRLAPMVLDEINRLAPGVAVFDEATRNWKINRALLPASGPVIVFEDSGQPYLDYQFRNLWRNIARAAGVPDKVKNMDTRSGAISEATASGAPLDLVRHAAAHSDIAMTQRYDRIQPEATETVMKMRVESRNKK